MTETTDTGAQAGAETDSAALAAAEGQTTDTGAQAGAETGQDGAAEGADGSTEPAAKPKKPIEEIFKGRVGHLTKQLAGKDETIADLQARLDAAESLVNARGGSDAGTGGQDGAPPPAAAPSTADRNPATGRVYTEAEIEALADRRAAQREFNRAADASYQAGMAQFPDWEEAIGNLKSLEIMSPQLLDAALATDEAPAVLHHLGKDPEEAARIVSLPPARMGAELAKLALKLSTPASRAVSTAPDPISPVVGRASPSVDLEKAAEGSMADYAAARAKQGARWAQGRA